MARPAARLAISSLQDHPGAFRLTLVLWVLGMFVFVALAVPALADLVQAVDDRVYQLAVDLEASVVVALAKGLDFIGSTWVTAPVMILVGVFLAVRRRWEALAFWFLAMVGSQLLIGPMKNLYERARPPLPLVETSGSIGVWQRRHSSCTASPEATVSLRSCARKYGSRNAFAIIVPCHKPYGEMSSPDADHIAVAPGATV